MNPVRKQRLVLILCIVIGAGAAVGLLTYSLSQDLDFFFTPTQVVNKEAPIGKRIRAGGLVVEGSVRRADNSLRVSFDLTDKTSSYTVHFTGILPDLFREGQGIIAVGKLNDDYEFIADEVLAKHDENYMPPEVKHAIEEAGHPVDSYQ